MPQDSRRLLPGLVDRSTPNAVALETTLLAHGVPAGEGFPLARELESLCEEGGGRACLVGLVAGVPIAGLTGEELRVLLGAGPVAKANTANLGVLMHRRAHAATTVASTMEIAAAAGVRVFATGGLGGVHHGLADRLDISSDLAALARFPVAVVCSGVKGILDVVSTREALETLGVPVVGFRTTRFPAFYRRDGGVGVDATFEDEDGLAAFLACELARTGRGVVVANPIPESEEIRLEEWTAWLDQARARAGGTQGRDVTPAILSALHQLSNGRTLRANIALVKSNTSLAARLAGCLVRA